MLAVNLLDRAANYELGFCPPQFAEGGLLYPPYVRGQAYLLLHKGTEAAGEFQKLVDHRGIVINYPIGLLGYLGLARAFTIEGDVGKAVSPRVTSSTYGKMQIPESQY